jgi:hypothetical protein
VFLLPLASVLRTGVYVQAGRWLAGPGLVRDVQGAAGETIAHQQE